MVTCRSGDCQEAKSGEGLPKFYTRHIGITLNDSAHKNRKCYGSGWAVVYMFDASVLVSAFLFPENVLGQVIRLSDQGLYALYVSSILMEKVTRSLNNLRS